MFPSRDDTQVCTMIADFANNQQACRRDRVASEKTSDGWFAVQLDLHALASKELTQELEEEK